MSLLCTAHIIHFGQYALYLCGLSTDLYNIHMTRSYHAAQDEEEDWSKIHAAEIKMGHWPITLMQLKIK